MKKILSTSAFLLLIFFTSYSQNDELAQEVSSPVQSAIVYLYGAEVTHTKPVSLNEGRNKIVFTGLSAKLNPKSIRVTASGDASLLAISDAINYLSNQKESSKVKQLRDSVVMITDVFNSLNQDKNAFVVEKEMLLKNESIGSKEKGVAITELRLAADFYRSRVKEINAEVLKLDKKITEQNTLLSKSNRELIELNAKNNQPTAEVTILLYSVAKTSSNIVLKYLVSDAGWAPSYDLKAEDINQPIELKYHAKVFNNTGVDWNNIKLKLSTADPSQSAAKPILSPWDLNFETDNYNKTLGHANARFLGNEGQMDLDNNKITTQDEKSSEVMLGGKAAPVKFAQIEVSELSAEFDIKNNYTVPSDAKPYIVNVTEYKLPATFQHFSVPKLEKDAFLLARITGWEDLDLVEGPANVYYGGSYVGQSYIYTRSVDDTLDLSLGRDNKVLVTRSNIKEYSSKKLFGSFVKETFAYEMVIKNNRKTPVQIDVEDQIPLSTQNDITVEQLETSKGLYDPKTGKLTWTYNLQPGDVKKITLSYSIKYPQATHVNVKKKMRSVSCPSF